MAENDTSNKQEDQKEDDDVVKADTTPYESPLKYFECGIVFCSS